VEQVICHEHEEHLGPQGFAEIVVCPLCSGKACSVCGCGWVQWSPPDDPDELRSLADVREYCHLLMLADVDEAQSWLGLLAVGVDGRSLGDAHARCDWSEYIVRLDDETH
jgi:hypothetical protein